MKPIVTKPFGECYINQISENTYIYDLYPELEKHIVSGVSGWLRYYVFNERTNFTDEMFRETMQELGKYQFGEICSFTNENGTVTLFESVEDGEWSETWQQYGQDYYRYVCIIESMDVAKI